MPSEPHLFCISADSTFNLTAEIFCKTPDLATAGAVRDEERVIPDISLEGYEQLRKEYKCHQRVRRMILLEHGVCLSTATMPPARRCGLPILNAA